MYQTKGAAQDIFIKLPNMALPPPPIRPLKSSGAIISFTLLCTR